MSDTDTGGSGAGDRPRTNGAGVPPGGDRSRLRWALAAAAMGALVLLVVALGAPAEVPRDAGSPPMAAIGTTTSEPAVAAIDTTTSEPAMVAIGTTTSEPAVAAAGPDCHRSYTPCVPVARDVDCAGGSGDGPAFTDPVRVIGPDVYDLDPDGDGLACGP